MDRLAGIVRQRENVGLGDRAEQGAVEELVEIEYLAVQRFERVVVLDKDRLLGRIGRRGGAAAEHGGKTHIERPRPIV